MSLDLHLFQLKSAIKSLSRKRRLCASAERTAMEMCRTNLVIASEKASPGSAQESAHSYATDADRSRTEAEQLHRLCCRLDGVVRTVQSAVALGRACPSMVRLVQALDAASQHLDCEAMEAAAAAFEKAFPRHDLDNHSPACPAAPSASTTAGTYDPSRAQEDVGGSEGFDRRISDRPDLVAERIAALLSRAAEPLSRSDSCS